MSAWRVRVRWVLVLPVAWAAWAVSVAIGFGMFSLAETLCPADQIDSGMCIAPWFSAVARAIVCFGAGLAAALVTLSCTLVAPSHRRPVAWVMFGVGSLIALAMAVATDSYAELVTAIAAGALTLAWLRRRAWLTRRRGPAPDSPRPCPSR